MTGSQHPVGGFWAQSVSSQGAVSQTDHQHSAGFWQHGTQQFCGEGGSLPVNIRGVGKRGEMQGAVFSYRFLQFSSGFRGEDLNGGHFTGAVALFPQGISAAFVFQCSNGFYSQISTIHHC